MRDLHIFLLGGLVLLLGIGGSSAVAAVPDRSFPPETDAAVHAGLSADQYSVERSRVSRHQTFSDLLTPHGVSYQTVVQLADAARPTFDVRDIKAGQPYQVYVNPWLERPEFLVYQIDAVEYVVFDIRQPSESYRGRREVEREWTMVEGHLEGSLYETLLANDTHPKLALRLSEVFAWQMDFFRIRAGDSFRILYEQRTVGGERIAPGKILAACFDHQGETYYGFRFDDGQGPQYFDRQGQSLRRQLLKAPLRYSRISSGYSKSRLHPVLKRRRPHTGVDYAAPTGTPVHSVGQGTVVKAGHYGNNGNFVKIRHNGTFTSGYLHLSSIADGIDPGAQVQQGETIGFVGSTGMSTGPHLDYRLWKRGQPVDPYELELPPSRPVNPQYRAEFEELVEDRLDRLFPLRVLQERAASLS